VTWRRIAIAAATLVAVVASPERARAADPDPWLGRDKTLHFAASSTLAAGGYAIGAAVFDARAHALICGAALAAAAGIGKEALDLAGLGSPSWKDLAWDAVGIAAGLAVAWSVDLLARGVSEKRPLLIAPRVNEHGAGIQVMVTF
jgi:putative lipoprotein